MAKDEMRAQVTVLRPAALTRAEVAHVATWLEEQAQYLRDNHQDMCNARFAARLWMKGKYHADRP